MQQQFLSVFVLAYWFVAELQYIIDINVFINEKYVHCVCVSSE